MIQHLPLNALYYVVIIFEPVDASEKYPFILKFDHNDKSKQHNYEK